MAAPCLGTLFGACQPAGACTSSGGLGITFPDGGLPQLPDGGLNFGVSSNLCYANGVKLKTSTSLAGGVTTAYKADGSVCYTQEIAFQVVDGVSVRYTYKNASGQVVATGMASGAGAQSLTITCAGSSQTYQFNTSCVPMGEVTGGAACTPGVCN